MGILKRKSTCCARQKPGQILVPGKAPDCEALGVCSWCESAFLNELSNLERLSLLSKAIAVARQLSPAAGLQPAPLSNRIHPVVSAGMGTP